MAKERPNALTMPALTTLRNRAGSRPLQRVGQRGGRPRPPGQRPAGLPGTRMTARSDSSSRPTTSKSSSRPSENVATPSDEVPTTCADVSKKPSGVTTTADPRPRHDGRLSPAHHLEAGDRRDQQVGHRSDHGRIGIESASFRSWGGRPRGPITSVTSRSPRTRWSRSVLPFRATPSARDDRWRYPGCRAVGPPNPAVSRRRPRSDPLPLDPRAAGPPSSTIRTSNPSVSGRPTAFLSPPRRAGRDPRRDEAGRVFPTPEEIGAPLEIFAGGDREVEALPEPVRVDADETAFAIHHRPARGARQERRRVLRVPVIRRPRGPRKVRSVPDTRPKVTLNPRPPGFENPNTGDRSTRPLRRSPSSRGCISCIHLQHGEIAAGSTPRVPGSGAPVVEGDGRLVAPDVVCVRQDQSGGYDHTGALDPAVADPHDRGAHLPAILVTTP